eukprot:4345051-Amphidinium_carterae.2
MDQGIVVLGHDRLSMLRWYLHAAWQQSTRPMRHKRTHLSLLPTAKLMRDHLPIRRAPSISPKNVRFSHFLPTPHATILEPARAHLNNLACKTHTIPCASE